jgi:methyltransferase (TIGR00027 family)
MSKDAAKTGLGPTALIAMEQFNPLEERIVKDPLAYGFLPLGMKIFLWFTRFDVFRHWLENSAEKSIPGMWLGMLLRKKYIDDLIVDIDSSIEAFVNLGAGFDTRLFRLNKDLPVFELDQKINIQKKRTLVKKQLGEIPRNINLIDTDFSQNDVIKQLEMFGYDTSDQTFFIMEGVTQYLEEKTIAETFEFLSKAKKNSQLVFTYVRKDFIDGKVMYGWEAAYKKYVKKGLWTFGLLPSGVDEFLKKYGYQLIEDLSFYDLSHRMAIKDRGLTLTEVERIVHCIKE